MISVRQSQSTRPSEDGVRKTEIKAVRELPASPEDGAYYVFSGIPRDEITALSHGLHKYPAKFIPQIPQWALGYRRAKKKETVLDPFCGSGTTLVEVGINGGIGIGFDISPLAVKITCAKTSTLADSYEENVLAVQEILNLAKTIYCGIRSQLVEQKECLGLHKTWSFWFRKDEMSKLLALRKSIETILDRDDQGISNFLLVCLSSIAKSSSFLNEDQIKVRFDHEKNIADPFKSFEDFSLRSLKKQCEISQIYIDRGTSLDAAVGSAEKIFLPSESIDRVITSPPYINAVDYTMAHKYNLFLLGLVLPGEFKEHCRDYIGMTERAVRAGDLKEMPTSGIELIDKQVEEIWNIGTSVSRNRAFVIYQYFSGMNLALSEIHRVLRSKGKAIMVVGNINRICKREIKTAHIIEILANNLGLETELCFHHILANRSSMRLNRSSTGGQVKYENVYVFNKI